MTAGSTTAKQALHEMIEAMSEKEAEDLLDYLNLLADPDELTEEELRDIEVARQEIARGEYVTLEEFRKKRGV